MSITTTPIPMPAAQPMGANLVERLRDPTTAAAIDGLLDRLDRLTRTFDALSAMAERAPGAIAMVTDAADEACAEAAARGVDLDERLRLTLRLAERLTAPRTVEVLTKLVDRIDTLERVLSLADQAPGLVAMVVDSADELMRETHASGLDVEKGLVQGASAAIRFGAMMGPEEVASLEAVFRSGILEPRAVGVVGGVGRALATAAAAEPQRVGPMGLLRALRDPDVQRALGLLLRLAASLGRDIAAPNAPRSTL